MAAIGAPDGGADSIAALGEVEAVAGLAADSVIGNPADERGVDAALEDEVFDEAADGVFGDGGDDGSAKAEGAAEAAGDVVFAATLRGGEMARGVDAAFAGIEAQHYFAEADTVPPAVFGLANVEVGHDSPNIASELTIKNGWELGKREASELEGRLWCPWEKSGRRELGPG